MSIKKWRVLSYDREKARKFAAEAGIPALLAVLLQTRGISGRREAETVFSDDFSFSDPFLLPDMDKAAERIGRALDGFEKIAVYGDYDADGVTATAMMYSYLESCGGNVVYYIPDRESEGYGLNKKAIDVLHGQDVRLILTVDNGISSVEEVDYANGLGMDTVITDHHRPEKKLPDAAAVVDAWRQDSKCPFSDYSGAGVAFKVLTALEGPECADAVLENYADLAAIGTVGDVVPLTGENRILVKAGLKQIARTDRIGLRALLEQSGMENRPLTAESMAFTIVPRINATGRMGSADRAVRLLTTESPEEGGELAAEVCRDNAVRKQTEEDVLREAMEQLDRNPALRLDRVLVVAGEGWHHGVIGIVAARIVECFGKPCVVISYSGGEAKGSGRSVPGFSLFEAVCSCGKLLTRFGGHPMAAGMSLPAEKIEAFREQINRYAASLPQPMPAPELRIDCLLKPEKLSVEIAESLRPLEPFGTGNPYPLFGLAGMKICDVTPVGGGKHLRVSVKKESCVVPCMRFGTTLEQFPYRVGDTVDLAVVLEVRPYNGRDTLSVVIREMRFTGTDEDELIAGRALYEKFRRGEAVTGEEAERILPKRGEFAEVYRALRDDGEYRGTAEDLFQRISGKKPGFPKLLMALAVFSERGLIDCSVAGGTCSIRIVPRKDKVNLGDSPLFSSLRTFVKAGEQQNGMASENV